MIKHELTVKSTVIDWQDGTMMIRTDEDRYVIPLDKTIQVTMVGYPNRETKTMPARDLGVYLTKGYIIEQINFEEVDDADVNQTVLALLCELPEGYPLGTFTKETNGYRLMIDRTMIFQGASGEDAVRDTKHYVEARKKTPDLPVGVIYGIYD